MKNNSENNIGKQRRLANLTAKQRLFVREYCRHLNATRAAIAAGYSEKGAAQAGARLSTNVKVSAEVAKLTQKACEKLEISAENVLRELARLAFLDPRKFYNENGGLKHVTELDDDTAACLAGMEVEDLLSEFFNSRACLQQLTFHRSPSSSGPSAFFQAASNSLRTSSTSAFFF